MQIFSKFFYILQGKTAILIGMIALFLATSILELLGIGTVGSFISIATQTNTIEEVPYLNVIYETLGLKSKNQLISLIGTTIVLVFYIKSYLAFRSQKWIFSFGFNQQKDLISRLMKIYIKAPYEFHLKTNSAILLQNVTDESQRFCAGFMMPLLTCISNFIVAVTLVILLVSTDISACLIIAGLFGIIFLLYQSLKYRLEAWGKEASVARAEIIRAFNEGIGGLKENRVIDCDHYFQERLDTAAKTYSTSTALALSYTNLPRFVIEAFLITFLVIFTLLSVLINHSNSGNMTSTLSIFALASMRLMPIASSLTGSLNSTRTCAYSIHKLYADLKELEEPLKFQTAPKAHTTRLKSNSQSAFQNEIILDSVSYHYPQVSINALEQVNLKILKGQSIGLIGTSGAGKTTLVDVILGLLIPQSGDIRIDGVSIYESLRNWQNIVGYVPQSISLIDESLTRNIALGISDDKIDYAKLKDVIETAQLSDLVNQLPNGIHTRIGEQGVMLSGGQRQRLGIARALYHEREVLVFDEATAALDNETERMITESMKALVGKKTMIIIAHRLSTIEHCDLIIEMKNGCVLKTGTYREIVQR